jgi:hypothetical protein
MLIWAKCKHWCLKCLTYLDSCSHGCLCELTVLECCLRLRRGRWDQCFLLRLCKCLPECMASHPRRQHFSVFNLLANLHRWKSFGIPAVQKRLGDYSDLQTVSLSGLCSTYLDKRRQHRTEIHFKILLILAFAGLKYAGERNKETYIYFITCTLWWAKHEEVWGKETAGKSQA